MCRSAWRHTMKLARSRAWVLGPLAALALFAWQAATVTFNYQGNWTALFCTGAVHPLPPALSAGTYIFANSTGYDGQWYRIIAHDPWLRQDLWRYIDDPQLRYRRILLPATAWLLALGRPAWIDTAYLAVVLVFVGLGTVASAWWLKSRGWPEYYAIAFPVLPGTLVCVDRMTVDVALYAFVAIALAAAASQRWGLCWISAVLAALTRDLGFVLIAGLAVHAFVERAWRRVAALALCGLPALLWYIHLRQQLPGAPASPIVPVWALHKPVIGHLVAILNPPDYPFGGVLGVITQSLDSLVVAAAGYAAWLALSRIKKWFLLPEDWIALGFAGVFLMVGTPGFWRDPYSSVRAFTPLVSLVGLRIGGGRVHWAHLPLLCFELRTVWQMGRQALGIWEAVWRIAT